MWIKLKKYNNQGDVLIHSTRITLVEGDDKGSQVFYISAKNTERYVIVKDSVDEIMRNLNEPS